jgi:hypothetical protein
LIGFCPVSRSAIAHQLIADISACEDTRPRTTQSQTIVAELIADFKLLEALADGPLNAVEHFDGDAISASIAQNAVHEVLVFFIGFVSHFNFSLCGRCLIGDGRQIMVHRASP